MVNRFDIERVTELSRGLKDLEKWESIQAVLRLKEIDEFEKCPEVFFSPYAEIFPLEEELPRLPSRPTVADIGCGTGFMLELISQTCQKMGKGGRYIGTSLTNLPPVGVHRRRFERSIEYYQTPTELISVDDRLPKAEFDLIIAKDSLRYSVVYENHFKLVGSTQAALLSLFSLLKVGGRLLIYDMDGESWFPAAQRFRTESTYPFYRRILRQFLPSEAYTIESKPSIDRYTHQPTEHLSIIRVK